MLPHVPFNVTKNCDPRAENKNRYEGYKESYQCALKEISDFTKYIYKILKTKTFAKTIK